MKLASKLLLLPLVLVVASFAASSQADDEQAAREAKFIELLSGVKLVGSFTMSDDPKDELHEDSYTIQKVEKVGENRFEITALVEFGERSAPISLALPVYWAGDTPVITVSEVSFPMLGTYSARVLFHGDRYVGVWEGGDHGGHMFGTVEPLEESEPAAAEASESR